MAIEWTSSADKHGVDRDDALHAIENAYYLEQEFDEPRKLGDPLLEVMVEVTPPRDMLIFHVMQARQKHLDRMNDE